MPNLQNMTDIGYSPFTIRQFLAVFFPAALFLALLVAAMQYHEHALMRENLQASQARNIAITVAALNRDFDSIFVDLALLESSPDISRFAADPTPSNRQLAENELTIFHRYNSMYDDIAYVNLDGQRLLATDTSQTSSQTSEIDQQLIRQLLAPDGERPARNIIVSPLTLSTDNQGTLQPIMHFAIAVRDSANQVLGVLIATYTASRLLLNLNSVMSLQADTHMLINRDGNWLQHSGADQGKRWSTAQAGTFDKSYPSAWRHMQAADSGQFKTSKGIFTFATILPAGFHETEGNSSKSSSWIVASLITTETLAAALASEFRQGMLIYLLLLIPTALCCLYAARSISTRLHNQRRISALGAAVEQSHDMILITNAAGRIRYVNPRFEEITGYSRAEVINNSPSLMKSGKHNHTFYQRLWSTISRGDPFESTIINQKKNGDIIHLQMTISPLTDKSDIIGYVSTAKDITSQVSTQERLLELAFHHPLTGLPNRSLFRDHLHDAAARARRSNHKVAVLFIDLDRFKQINDSLGHQVGDAILIAVAQRLRDTVREIDMVAHLGGDEFTILLDAIQHPNQVQAVTAKLLQLFENPFPILERELYLGASIGIAMFPTDSDNVETLIELADTAMYQAKRAGRGQFQFYSAEMTTLANERLEIESQLRIAVQKQEFRLLFQPIVDPISQDMRGLEALIRWHLPDGTVRTPDEFIPILEETGMIIPVTSWVLSEACRQYRRMQKAGLGRVRINVNISARSFYQGNLVRIVSETLRQNNMPAAQLVLEVTESLLLEDQRHVQNALEQLRQLGVSIAIDDFGTGYSSLAYLRRLPINIIKIDRAFIHGVGRDGQDAALVSAMMAMAQELQMGVIAEGVEDAHQLEFLRQRRCRGVQGFLFSRPAPASHINDLLKQDPHWPWKTWMNHQAADRLH